MNDAPNGFFCCDSGLMQSSKLVFSCLGSWIYATHTSLQKDVWCWYGDLQKRVRKFWIITHGQTYKQQNTEKTAASMKSV